MRLFLVERRNNPKHWFESTSSNNIMQQQPEEESNMKDDTVHKRHGSSTTSEDSIKDKRPISEKQGQNSHNISFSASMDITSDFEEKPICTTDKEKEDSTERSDMDDNKSLFSQHQTMNDSQEKPASQKCGRDEDKEKKKKKSISILRILSSSRVLAALLVIFCQGFVIGSIQVLHIYISFLFLIAIFTLY